MNQELFDSLCDCIKVDAKNIKETEIKVQSISFLQLRDIIWTIGRVVLELPEKEIYIAAVKAGSFASNTAYLAIKRAQNNLEIIGYAKEGIIKQGTIDKAIDKLESAIQKSKTDRTEKTAKKPQKKAFCLRLLIVILFLSVSAIGCLYAFLIIPTISSTNKYNDAVEAFNSTSDSLETAIENTCIDNIEGIVRPTGRLNKENTDLKSVINTLLSGNSAKMIQNDTNTILEMTGIMDNNLRIVTQITNPSSEWVIEKLDTLNEITGKEAVSPENDPNQMLGKPGGYTSCVYFTISSIDSNSVEGNNIVAKGTDAGGSIEVYENVADAEARCEYLAGFDNTLLYSGSYAIIGTMVVRTSYRLYEEDQYNLTNEITKAFTTL